MTFLGYSYFFLFLVNFSPAGQGSAIDCKVQSLCSMDSRKEPPVD